MFDPRSITTELTFKNPYRAPGSLDPAVMVEELRTTHQDAVRGLLALFVGLQFFGAIAGIRSFAAGAGSVLWARQQGFASLAATLRAERLLLPLSVLAIFFGTTAIMLRWRHTPVFWQVYLASTACLSAYFGFRLLGLGIEITNRDLGTGLLIAAAQYSGTVVGSLLWLMYWGRSKRVLARFHAGITT